MTIDNEGREVELSRSGPCRVLRSVTRWPISTRQSADDMFRRIVSARGLGNGFATYVQGQYPKSGGREYFYYIDHQGMVGLWILVLRRLVDYIFIQICSVIFLSVQLFLDDSPMKNFTSCFKGCENVTVEDFICF